MMYSVEDRVNSPQNDQQKKIKNRKSLNQDIEPEESGGFSQYSDSNNGHDKSERAEKLVRHNENTTGAKGKDYEPQESANATPTSRIDTKAMRSISQAALSKASRSKQNTVSKGKRSRVGHRRGSTHNFEGTHKTGTISIAMQILNMDEEEKEYALYHLSIL